MGLSNAERQARWRTRLQKRLADLERAAKVGSTPLRNDTAEVARLKARIVELQQECDRMHKENVFLQTHTAALEMMAGHKSFIPRETYRKILACLHPDRGASDKMLGEAFAAFRELEYTLFNHQQERKAKAKAKREAKKAAAKAEAAS
jgi:hypothetical protein